MTVICLAVATGVAGTNAEAAVAFEPAAVAQAIPPATDTVPPDGIPEERRDALLGSSWKSDGDVATIVMGGSEGVAVLSAASKDGYAWREVASLPAVGGESDLWISNSCVTSSGRYMAIVYAPRSVTNSEEAFGFGGTAVIVDLSSGSVRELGTGYSIAYYNPGCGAEDTFTLTAHAPGVDGTLIAVVDAVTGAAVSKVTVDQQATSAVSRRDGTIYAATSRGILRVQGDAKPTVVVATRGVAYDLALDDAGRLGYVTFDGEVATAYVATIPARKTATAIATGTVTEISLQRAHTGGFYLLGDELKILTDDSTVRRIPGAVPGSDISVGGQLVVNAIKPAGIAPAQGDITEAALSAQLGTVATVSGESVSFDLGEYEPAFSSTQRGSGASHSSFGGQSADPHDPAEAERYCSVPRNDVSSQAYQPKPRQVQWAVDRAVKNQLMELRPANWRNLGMDAYQPQVMFPRTALTGGGTIPPHLVLGVLMQESNMWQASRYTAPGNTGNPLIGNFYGNSSNLWQIQWSQADCGYGVGQITDGMRLAGHEKPGETALPETQQRAIAVDYAANVAKAVQMLGEKWNQTRALGITINNGSASSLENWFAAIWAYNTGLQPSSAAYGNGTGCSPGPSCTTSVGTWGLGWYNNPINPEYAAYRLDFLGNDNAADAAHPQDWPYPEKVLGFAAWGLSLVETQWADPTTRTYPTKLISSYTLPWWTTDSNRVGVKPPLDTFCVNSVNLCNPLASSNPCTLSTSFCYWHGNATWKNCNATSSGPGDCGISEERFPYPAYASEASSMSNPALPIETRTSSFLPNCIAPPVTMLIVDDTYHGGSRNAGECSRRATTGSFEFTFHQIDPTSSSYPAKVDLHQQGGGFNSHFYFTRVRTTTDYPTRVTGQWSLGQSLTNQWTRVWIHLPDYAAWTDNAAYTITYGPGQSQTRYLPQRRYQNSWVPIGVFQVNGVPTVSLSNVSDVNFNLGYDDIAWDAVGFQLLSSKPADFVVGLGDSFSSGEGAGNYAPWSDHDGASTIYGSAKRNACHQSANSWIGKSVLAGSSASIATRSNTASPSSTLDFHFLACSGAESEHLLPRLTADPADERPNDADNLNMNAEGQRGAGQYGLVSQIDAGYLDENTTLVTLSIGGNDMRFAQILGKCFVLYANESGFPYAYCKTTVLPGDVDGAYDESHDRLDNELGTSLDRVLYHIQKRAPNAVIVLMGYPMLFETGSSCVGLGASNRAWLNDVSERLTEEMQGAADRADLAYPNTVVFADPQPNFTGRNLCTSNAALNPLKGPTVAALVVGGIVADTTRGDLPVGIPGEWSSPVSAESAHPNAAGTSLYADALVAALVGNYP